MKKGNWYLMEKPLGSRASTCRLWVKGEETMKEYQNIGYKKTVERKAKGE